MATKLQILNRALIKLGQKRITSATSLIKTAEDANEIYDTVRDRLLAAYPWRFAMDRRILSTPTTPPFGYTNSYTIPTNILRVVEINGQWVGLDITDMRTWTTDEHRMELGEILTDETTSLNIRGVKQITSEADFDPLFTEVLIADLAIELTTPLAVDNELRQLIIDDRATALNQAILGNSIETPPKLTPEETSYKWLALQLPPRWRGLTSNAQ